MASDTEAQSHAGMPIADGMDGVYAQWDPKLWKPTWPRIDFTTMLTNEDKELELLKDSRIVIDLTKSINRDNTKATSWIHRAAKLKMMGYADLAAGDAWKAVLLFDFQIFAFCRQRIDIPLSEAGKRLEVLFTQLNGAYQELLTSMEVLGDYHSVLEICAEGIKKYPEPSHDFFRRHKSSAMAKIEQFQGQSKVRSESSTGQKSLYHQIHGMEESDVRIQSGWTRFLPYPFMPAKYLMRQDDTVKEAQALFDSASSKCELSYSNVSGASGKSPNVLGVFATRDILPSERLLEDATALAACEISASAPSAVPARGFVCDNCYGQTPFVLPISPDCCSTGYCSQQCLDMAISTYHKVLCGQNFDWLYKEAKRMPTPFNLHGPLWLRILATCVQSGQHPLEHPAIARLVPSYSSMGNRIWSFTFNCTQPIRILQQLGINVFKDRRYETWVLQTIWARIANNQSEHLSDLEGGSVRTISPLYSFFNHSCEENAEVRGKSRGEYPFCSSGSTKVLVAKQKIKKGEEIFVSYVPFSGRETKEERISALQSWFGPGNGCGCTKCRRES